MLRACRYGPALAGWDGRRRDRADLAPFGGGGTPCKSSACLGFAGGNGGRARGAGRTAGVRSAGRTGRRRENRTPADAASLESGIRKRICPIKTRRPGLIFRPPGARSAGQGPRCGGPLLTTGGINGSESRRPVKHRPAGPDSVGRSVGRAFVPHCARRRGMPPLPWDGAALALASRVARNGLFLPEQGRIRVGQRVPHAWPLQAGACRTQVVLCRGASLGNPSLFQPEGTAWGGRRTFARGRGAGYGRGVRLLLVAWLYALAPKGGRMGYQSRKGRYLGVPALEGSERAVGAGLFRHVGGRRSFCQTGWPGLAAMVVGSRRPRDSVAGRAGGFAPR